MSKVEACKDRMENEARRANTDGAVSICAMLIRDGRGDAASSLSASMMLILSESSGSVDNR